VLLATLEQLTPDERAVLQVRFLGGRTIADAAEMLGLPPSEVIRLQAQALVAICRALDAR
jgi:DNA-directed RNA polymerase specialized sigma24 family protein